MCRLLQNLQEGANSETLLRSHYQACWLLRQIHQQNGEDSRSYGLIASLNRGSSHNFKDQVNVLSTSVKEMQQNFDEFMITIQEQGWALSKIVDSPFSHIRFASSSHFETSS
jgi:hypothetical protein